MILNTLITKLKSVKQDRSILLFYDNHNQIKVKLFSLRKYLMARDLDYLLKSKVLFYGNPFDYLSNLSNTPLGYVEAFHRDNREVDTVIVLKG